MTLKDAMGTDHKIRFEHIDAPEVNPSQFYGTTSRDALKSRLPDGVSVKVEVSGKDKYGRNLGVVKLLSGEDINLWMVAKGHAWHYKAYSSVQQYATAETNARQAKIGLWGPSQSHCPLDFSTTTGGREHARRRRWIPAAGQTQNNLPSGYSH